jgi:hypothetical protein
MITFDGPNNLIILDAATTLLTAEEIYSRWKDWVRAEGANYTPAFRIVGGDPIGGGLRAPSFVFLQNDLGWRIQKPSSNIEVVIQGNIFGEDPGLVLLVDPPGAFTPTVLINRTAVSNIDPTLLELIKIHARAANMQTQRTP